MSSVITNPTPVVLPNPRQQFVDTKSGLLTWQANQFLQQLSRAQAPIVPAFFSASHATRLTTPASSYPNGSVFYESDRTVTYIAVGGSWVYLAGVMRCPQASIPSDLAANDAGFLCFVTDFAHLLCWAIDAVTSILGWNWAPGEQGSDFVVRFVTGPDSTTGWVAADGSATTRLTNAGNIASATTPVVASSWYRR